jgi:hypothetical protein
MAISNRALAFVCLLGTPYAVTQLSAGNADRLPVPSGPYGVGRVTLLCEDSSRIEPLDPSASVRRIVVDVWYPAGPSPSVESLRAQYLDVAAFEGALGNDRLRKHLGGSYDFIKAGAVRTHAVEQAPFASHGYVVAAMTHNYDGFLAVFPDKSYITFDSRRWPGIPSVEGEANLNQLEWHTEDILAVLHHLDRINRRSSPQFPFAGRLDLTTVGAFGHSFGGVAAAHACQKELRLKACLNQDGAMGMKPFYLDARGWGMNQAFMLIERPPNRQPLSDADLAELKLTRARAMDLIARLNADRDRTMRSTGAGSYRVLLRREVTTHAGFSDLQVLSARNDAELAQRLRVLTVIRSYTRAFFDRHVRGSKAPLLDRPVPDEILESMETFGTAVRGPLRSGAYFTHSNSASTGK